jgi:signal transduction histidine kinase
VFGPGGELIYFFASQLDVTRRHEAEAMLRQAQRIETLGSVATGVAHEFNNLMTIVMGSLSQLERGIAGGSRDRARVERAMWAAGQAGQLTQQMLSFARRQFHDNRPTDINDAVRNLHGAVRQCAGPAINVTLDLWPGDLWVHLDTAQLEQAVLNLVKNAADAMPAGGALVVRTADVRGADAQGAAMAVLSVQDHGSGMAPDVAQRAPEPFFTTKANGAGTGLGLSMVVGFATQSGGTCRIDTAQGQGTTVSLSFPLLAASPRVP